ncbi:very short patch repair endonuclease [Erythrobacter sp. EC-HK427]|uniref:very short patch repair endonuclease n=1 Tax=Erythrobacter sp. EC-HK427 TaxID=2038396 RepID=UPI00125EDFA4|nr:very short patch repair endonuclease [Erythrobacter sp. EC-HK427]
MPDIVDAQTRSRMMSGIRDRDTAPEMLIRSGLHRMGFRYRLHDKKLPGRPDLVFPSRRAAIEVRGCFWHGHDCNLFRWPGTRPEFWRRKISTNIARDARNRNALLNAGWRLAEVWECQLKGRERQALEPVLQQLREFLEGDARHLVLGKDRTVDSHI